MLVDVSIMMECINRGLTVWVTEEEGDDAPYDPFVRVRDVGDREVNEEGNEPELGSERVEGQFLVDLG